MQINMTTFAGRRTPYIHDTLRSLFASDWHDAKAHLNLILGSEDDSHVRQYVDDPSVHIVPWDVESDPNLRWNCTLNKIRALQAGDGESLLICEDDILFQPDWFSSLRKAAAELQGVDYVLSLFAAEEILALSPLVEGKTRIREYPTRVLQGAQALYYPKREIREKVATYLGENLKKACGDDLIGRWARGQAALYSTREILVSHFGATSCFHLETPAQ